MKPKELNINSILKLDPLFFQFYHNDLYSCLSQAQIKRVEHHATFLHDLQVLCWLATQEIKQV